MLGTKQKDGERCMIVHSSSLLFTLLNVICVTDCIDALTFNARWQGKKRDKNKRVRIRIRDKKKTGKGISHLLVSRALR